MVKYVLRAWEQLKRGVEVLVKRYPEPHGQVTAYNWSPVH